MRQANSKSGAIALCTTALAALLGACSGGSTPVDLDLPTGPVVETVSGPLDEVQSALSDQVLAPMSTAARDTPLGPVIDCLDQAVVQHAMDLLDAAAAGIGDPAAAQEAAAALQTQLLGMAEDLETLVYALGGYADCSGAPVRLGPGNPLAATALAALGDVMLPAMQNAARTLASGELSPDGLQQVATQMQLAIQAAAGQVAASAGSAPPVSGILTAAMTGVGTAVTVLGALRNDPQALPQAIAGGAQDIAEVIVTRVVPVLDLQQLAGGGDAVAGLQAGVAAFGEALAAALSGGPAPDPGLLSGFVDPAAAVAGQIAAALPEALSGLQPSADPAAFLTDAVLPAVASVLAGLVGGSCPLAEVPLLAVLCPG